MTSSGDQISGFTDGMIDAVRALGEELTANYDQHGAPIGEYAAGTTHGDVYLTVGSHVDLDAEKYNGGIGTLATTDTDLPNPETAFVRDPNTPPGPTGRITIGFAGGTVARIEDGKVLILPSPKETSRKPVLAKVDIVSPVRIGERDNWGFVTTEGKKIMVGGKLTSVTIERPHLHDKE